MVRLIYALPLFYSFTNLVSNCTTCELQSLSYYNIKDFDYYYHISDPLYTRTNKAFKAFQSYYLNTNKHGYHPMWWCLFFLFWYDYVGWKKKSIEEGDELSLYKYKFKGIADFNASDYPNLLTGIVAWP